jgi:hypothetical protein
VEFGVVVGNGQIFHGHRTGEAAALGFEFSAQAFQLVEAIENPLKREIDLVG